MFRPQIKVIDCTIRDGGLMNKWQFEDDLVEQVYLADTKAGIDYMEIWYLSSESAFSREEYGPWKVCAEADIQRIIRHLCERDIGVLITDHNVRETLGICGRAYILSDGSLIASGPPAEILDNQHVREVYLGQEFKL